ncbi:hypothetical protein BCR33DRAFT_779441 [Rhizoclosmatium globosum]|uniref:Uncharacterized protein n=1 Tax=Rhizoclosmatium globosum TaxID=329046 RepID=A0A1Y2D1E0_9FUNG|nr:hypothetical protein BCR33DRAFT_779441 [Rhizoclosmatium globosum]|eukprot:ORY53092.1 hypothetical protein BCR33DRAFT_779441 [Rhizoclosmatium globosum]
MTFITVLVQHAWAMQPAGASSTQPRNQQKDNVQDQKKRPRRIPEVRVSIPATVTDFVQVFNQETSPELRQSLDTYALDVLSRLEDLVLASTISFDSKRKDPMRVAAKDVKQKTFKKRILSARTRSSMAAAALDAKEKDDASDAKKNLLVRTQTRRYAAQARRSLLALATARSRVIRAKCIALLIEALDTNELGADDGAGDVLEGALEARRMKTVTSTLAAIDLTSEVGTDAEMKDGQNLAVPVDDFLEKLAICISLSVQRLEYACDIKSFFIPGEVQGAFHRLFNENLMYLETNDPYTVQMITSSVETIHWLMTAKVESEELMATPVALSLLSQITRMTPNLGICEMLEPFSGILNDLKEKQEWHLGCKFIKLMAAGAAINDQACQLFLGIVKQLDPECWQWTFCAIMCLGAVVLTTDSSAVRKLALENGLLEFIDFDRDNDDHWRVRAAAAICLAEIYHHNKSESLGLLAHEAIRERKEVEKNSHVIELLTISTSLSHHPRRVSFLFKYICLSLAETYAESQSRYSFLRKFLKSTAHRKSTEAKKLAAAKAQKPFNTGPDSLSQKATKFIWPSRNLNLPDVKKLSKRAGDLLKMVEEDAMPDDNIPIPLSIAPYHQNYKTEAEEKTKPILKPSKLAAVSYKTGHEIAPTNISNPSNGTVNRRKLFNATTEEAS